MCNTIAIVSCKHTLAGLRFAGVECHLTMCAEEARGILASLPSTSTIIVSQSLADGTVDFIAKNPNTALAIVNL